MSADALSGGTRTEPSFWNRLLAVTTAVFAVPVLLELHVVAGGVAPAPADVRVSIALAAALLAGAAAAGLFGRLRRAPELRTARALALLLSCQAGVLLARLLA